MADEKVQELSLEDLESVGGGVKIDRGDEKKKTTAVVNADKHLVSAEAEVSEIETAGLRVAKQIW